MARSSFQIAQKDIKMFFKKQEYNVYSFTGLGAILDENRVRWKISVGMSTRGFIERLLKYTELKKHEFNFPKISIARYSWGESDIYSLVSDLFKNSYLSHYSALFTHNLTEQDPKVVYLNNEQTAKPQNELELSQHRIDAAFSKPPRVTNNVCTVNNYRIYLLSGKKTDNLGVVNRLTNLERTLIDITVRPNYAGGVFEVLKAYEKARDSLSVSYMATILNKIAYTYPYHQSIGFYLERAGYSSDQVAIFENYPREFNFYLENDIEEMDYSEKWRIYYPKGI